MVGLEKGIIVTVPHWRKNGTAAVAWLLLLLFSLVIVGCQLGSEAPQMRVTPGAEPHTKVVDGYLYVAHSPCPPSMVAPPAAITVTEMYSQSIIYLNGDGSVSATQKPDYRTEEGRSRLQKALADRSTVRLILTLPKCPERK